MFIFLFQVTPTGRHALTYDEESWREKDDNTEEITRQSETRKSKTKRMKNYLKKCKNVLGNRSSSSLNDPGGGSGGGCGLGTSYDVTPSNSSSSTSSWYIDKSIAINECEINELEDVYEEVSALNINVQSTDEQSASLIDFKRPCSKYFDNAIDECKYSDLEPIKPCNESEQIAPSNEEPIKASNESKSPEVSELPESFESCESPEVIERETQDSPKDVEEFAVVEVSVPLFIHS